MLSISSTTIIIKALDELKLKKHRFAELIFAVLIVEDLFAILLLVALGTIAVSQSIPAIALLVAALKLVLVVGGWFLTGYFVVPRFLRYVGRIGNDEMLTILSLGLCLALVVFANHFHYSTALGAFIMGSIIAESPVLSRVEANMASLRDVFGAIFFVSIGMLIDPRVLWENLGSVAILCAVTIVGKVLSTGFGALISGQSVRNSVQVGFGLAQIGEFSFIIAQLGLSLKVISPAIYPIIVAVSLVTTFTTPYLIRLSNPAALAVEARLPEGMRVALNRYAALAEARRAQGQSKRVWVRPGLRWVINGLTVSVVFYLCSGWMMPMLQQRASLPANLLPVVSWLVAIALSAPFIWAMLTAFRREKGKTPEFQARSLFAMQTFFNVLTFCGLAGLSSEFFSKRYVLLITVTLLLLGVLLFYRRLERAYHWLEHRFLATFEADVHRPVSPEAAFHHLAPWDAHLVTLQLHPNSSLTLKKISDAELRARYGVNIVAIQRGRVSIVTPAPDELLLPQDQLVLLGTDEQVEKVRLALETPEEVSRSGDTGLAFQVRQIGLSAGCSLVGKTIRQSGIREKYQAMAVGLERGGLRNINPKSDLELREGDLLWIAGEKSKLEQFVKNELCV
jgi:CPA2 family monovalent cation:H+ antiporter-2